MKRYTQSDEEVETGNVDKMQLPQALDKNYPPTIMIKINW